MEKRFVWKKEFCQNYMGVKSLWGYYLEDTQTGFVLASVRRNNHCDYWIHCGFYREYRFSGTAADAMKAAAFTAGVTENQVEWIQE